MTGRPGRLGEGMDRPRLVYRGRSLWRDRPRCFRYGLRWA